MDTLQTKGQAFKKKLILSEAAAILSEKPYESVTMDEVAKRLGCGKATLYKHFPSKELLFGEVIYGELEAFVTHITTITDNPPNILNAIRTCFSDCYDFFVENRLLFSSWLRYEPSGNANEFFEKVRKLLKDHEHCIEAIFIKAISEGYVHPFDAKVLATTIENIFLSCVFSPITNNAEDFSRSKLTLQAVLINGIFTESALKEIPEVKLFQ